MKASRAAQVSEPRRDPDPAEPEWAGEPIPIEAYFDPEGDSGGARVPHATTRYEIRDRTGFLQAIHVRVDGPTAKRLWWQAPDGQPGLDVPLADLPLYAIERLESHSCVVTEGEKAADALIERGIPAVGTVTGAGMSPSAGVLSELAGVRVVLWPDQDEVGRQHMRAIAAKLDGVAASLHWIEPAPDRAPGWDAADALREPGGQEFVEQLVHAALATPYVGSDPTNDRRSAGGPLPFRTAREVGEMVSPEIEWACRPWLAVGAITELAGRVKASGKTTFAFAMVKAIVTGTPFMDEPTTKSPVVILSEQPLRSLRVALERAGLLDHDDVFVLSWADARDVAWPELADQAIGECKDRGARVLLVDTLGQFTRLRGDAENDAGAAMEAFEPLHKAAAEGIAVFVTRHDRKGGGEVGESARGSSAFAGSADTLLRMTRPDGNMRSTIRKIESLSRFEDVPSELLVELTPSGYVALGSETSAARAAIRDGIFDHLDADPAPGTTIKELEERVGLDRSTLQRALDELLLMDRVERLGRGVRNDAYRWRQRTFVSAPPTVEVRAETIVGGAAGLSAAPLPLADSPIRSAQTTMFRGAETNEGSADAAPADTEWSS